MQRSLVAILVTLALLPMAAFAASAESPERQAPEAVAIAAPATRVGFWHGGFAPDCLQGGCPLDDFPAGTWRALREADAFINLGLTYRVDYGPGGASADALHFIRRAEREGVEVAAWLLADLRGGTFGHESNAPLMREAVRAFHRWNARHRLGIRDAILDLEFPVGTQLSDLPHLQAGFDTAHQCAAVRSYRGTIRWAGRHGIRLSGSPIPFALDDLLNGDLALADLLDLAPVLPEYHRLYLQAYRTYSNAGPDYVAGYLRDMRRLFGRTGQVTLGDTTMAVPYLEVGPLVADVRLAAGMGAERVPVFNLTGSLSKYGVAGIRAIGRAVRDPMTQAEIAAASAPQPLSTATRGAFRLLDTTATTLAALTGTNRFPNPCR